MPAGITSTTPANGMRAQHIRVAKIANHRRGPRNSRTAATIVAKYTMMTSESGTINKFSAVQFAS